MLRHPSRASISTQEPKRNSAAPIQVGLRLDCVEVEPVHAGIGHAQQPWRHAKPRVQIAEDLPSEAAPWPRPALRRWRKGRLCRNRSLSSRACHESEHRCQPDP